MDVTSKRTPVSYRKSLIPVAGVIGLLLIGALTYGFVLRLPFFSDDMPHYRWLEGQNMASIWSSARGMGYYRPLPFTLWRVLHLLQGRYDPPTLHALNLALHLINTLLVVGLVMGYRPRQNILFGLSAALLFLLYPFSYQAVPWVGALTHPLVTALILSALLLARLGIRHCSRPLFAGSIALALLAPFAHETGVLIAPLLTVLLLIEAQPETWRASLRHTIPFWACAGLGLLVWLLVPKGDSAGALFDLEARWRNGVYLLQGLAFPVAPLTLRVLRVTGRLDPLQATALVSGVAVTGWSLLLWRAGRGRLVLLALGWFILAAAPAWAFLEPEYVAAGGRLLYEPAVGAALFWSIPLSIHRSGRRLAIVGQTLAALVVFGAAIVGYRFIRARVPLYEQTRRAALPLVDARPQDPSAPMLVVNYPMWFALHRPTYAVGHDGVVFVPDYTSVRDLLWLHTGEERPVTSLILADLLPQDDWTYIFPCIGEFVDSDTIQDHVRQAGKVMVTRYETEHVAVYDAGGLEGENQPVERDHLAAFDRHITLRSATWERWGESLRVELYWQCRERLDQEITVFLHLYDVEGRLVSQADGYPVMGTSRPVSWRPGDLWRDVRILSLPATGHHMIRVGLYTVSDGTRLRATTLDGERFPDDAVPIADLPPE